MQFMRAVWAWCNESTVHQLFALWVLGTVTNLFVEVSTSKRWDAWAAAHPRLAGVLMIFKSVFGVWGGAARGFLSVVTAELQKRVGPAQAGDVLFQQLDGGDAKPQPATKLPETPPKA